MLRLISRSVGDEELQIIPELTLEGKDCKCLSLLSFGVLTLIFISRKKLHVHGKDLSIYFELQIL